MSFFRQVLLGIELKSLKKDLIKEKQYSATKENVKLNFYQRFKHKWLNCIIKCKKCCQKCYKCRKGTYLYKLSYNLRHDGSCENYTLKSVIGFIGGFILTYIFFMFFVFQLNFKLSSATVICSIFGCILTIGLAFSHKIRCIVLLLLPQFFSRRGRQALLAYAFILALTGPAKNTLNNMSILSESLACGQEQLKSAIKQIIEVLKVPFYAIRDAIKKVVSAVKEVIKQIKKILLAIKRIIIALAKVIKAAFLFLRKIVSMCNKELGTPFERCSRAFEDAITDCNAKLGPLFNWLCSITYIVQSVCYLVKIYDIVCLVVDFINDSIVGVIYRKIKTFVRHIRTMFYVRIKFSHSYHFETTQSKTMKEIYAGIITEIKKRTEGLMAIFDLMTCATSLFFLFIIVRVVYYRYKFLTNERFDNKFITKDFRLLDLRRAQLEKETVLPLNHRESKKYINPYKITLIRAEKVKLSKSAMVLGTATIKLTTHMACDYSLYWVLTVIREHARFQSKIQSPAMPTVHIDGKGFLADLLSGIVKAFQPLGIELEIDTVPCLPDPIPPDYDRYIQIGTCLLLCWVLTLLEPYGLRLRHAVMCYYYPQRAKERTIWLYNQIIRKRSSFLKFARRQLRKSIYNDSDIAKVTCKEYIRAHINNPLILYCLGSEAQEACMLCGEIFRGDDKIIRCATPGCKGIYCEQCFADLQNVCTICLDPIQYGDLSDIDLEKDSSEEEDRKKLEEKKKKKKKKKKRKGFLCFHPRGGDDDDDDDKKDGEGPISDTTDEETDRDTYQPTTTPYDSDVGTSDYTHTEDESSDYSYSYQLNKDIHAPQDKFPQPVYRDLEKQHLPDYASMDTFHEKTSIIMDTTLQAEEASHDVFYNKVKTKEDSIKEIKPGRFVTDYMTDVESDFCYEGPSKYTKSSKKEKYPDMIPLLERGGGDVKRKTYEPYKTNICVRCGKRHKICTCLPHTAQNKLQRNITALDLDKFTKPKQICQYCCQPFGRCYCLEGTCRKPDESVMRLNENEKSQNIVPPLNLSNLNQPRRRCKYCYQPYDRCYCIVSKEPLRSYSQRSIESTPRTLTEFNVTYKIDNEQANQQRYVRAIANISMKQPQNSRGKLKHTAEINFNSNNYKQSITARPDYQLPSTSQNLQKSPRSSVLRRNAEQINSSKISNIYKTNGPVNPSFEHNANWTDSSNYKSKVQNYYKKINSPTEGSIKKNNSLKPTQSPPASFTKVDTKSVLRKDETNLESATKNYRPVQEVSKNFTVAYSLNATYFKDKPRNLLMGGLVSPSADNYPQGPTDSQDINESFISLTEEKKRELYDSTDSEISVIDFDALLKQELREQLKGMKGKEGKERKERKESKESKVSKESKEGNSAISSKDDLEDKDGTDLKNSFSSRYSREPAEKDENNINIKLKKFSNTSEIRQYFQQNLDNQDMNCYNYTNPNECKAQCGCCNTTPYEQACDNNQDSYYYNQNYQRNEQQYNYNQSKPNHNPNYSHQVVDQTYPSHSNNANYQTGPSPSNFNNFPNDPFVKLSKNAQQYDNSQRRLHDDSSKHNRKSGYSFSSPEVMNRYKQHYYHQTHNDYPNKNERHVVKYPVDDANSDLDLYKKQSKKKYKVKQQQQKGCPCCHYNNYYEQEDQDSLCSEHSRSTEFMDLAYQQQGDYPNLVDELEDTITQRNKERVQKTLQHFEMISSGMKEPSALEMAEKPRYNYDPCPCQKYKHKNSNHPCYCIRGQCQYCDNFCKKYQQKYEQQCRGNCQQSNYNQKPGYVEKLVKNMDPNLNESVQKYPKFQNKFNNTHWKFDARSGEWIKVCDRNFDYDNSYPPLPPPPPSNEMYENNGERRQSRHQEYMNIMSPNQMNISPQNQHQDNYLHHKKNCMCNNCGMRRENRRY